MEWETQEINSRWILFNTIIFGDKNIIYRKKWIKGDYIKMIEESTFEKERGKFVPCSIIYYTPDKWDMVRETLEEVEKIMFEEDA